MRYQYERYRPHIEDMLKQEPYDLAPLIYLIKEAPNDEIRALLNNDLSGTSDLSRGMRQFRRDWAPRILTKPCMHYNFVSFLQGIKLAGNERENLYKASANNNDKIDLVWLQLISFLLRRLPGIDRCMLAQGLYNLINLNKPLKRSYEGGLNQIPFPITTVDDLLAEPIQQLSISIFGPASANGFILEGWNDKGVIYLEKIMLKKYHMLTKLVAPHRSEEPRSLCPVL